jgi:uncharacterized protein involved in type VI secretion and phage assembly
VTLEGDGADGWKFRSFQLEERIDAPYELIVDVTNDDTTADPLALLGQNATLTIERYAPRDIHGIVRRVERGAGGGTDREMHARLTIVPAVWALGRTRKTRIFQEMSVKDILQEVRNRLTDHVLRASVGGPAIARGGCSWRTQLVRGLGGHRRSVAGGAAVSMPERSRRRRESRSGRCAGGRAR